MGTSRKCGLLATAITVAVAPVVLGCTRALRREVAPVVTIQRPDPGLHPGDAVRVEVWREPDLTGEYTVDQNGVVVFPLIGERRVTGISGDSLERRLAKDYREYLESPSVNVTVLRRISILGQVHQPGLYPVDLTMNVTDALALAGGLSPLADRKKIQLVRNGQVVTDRLGAGTALASTVIRSGDQIVVEQRSWLSRNVGVVTAALGAIVTISAALIVR